jgi:hypothetical protein
MLGGLHKIERLQIRERVRDLHQLEQIGGHKVTGANMYLVFEIHYIYVVEHRRKNDPKWHREERGKDSTTCHGVNRG